MLSHDFTAGGLFLLGQLLIFKVGDQIFKMFSTSELEKPDQGIETKEEYFRMNCSKTGL